MATILVVDDRPTNLEFLTTLIGYTHHKAIEAADGAVALDLVQKVRPDLVITDILMPTMNGYELVEASLKMRPELKVLMMTAYPTDRPPPAALKAREIRTLVKPFDPDRMCNLVVDMLARP